jgi:phage terminase small subunit
MSNDQDERVPLNHKQQRFAEEYVVDHNATQAAKRAGYSDKVARIHGSRLMTNDDVMAVITGLEKEISKRTAINADRIRLEIGRIAFLDPSKILGFKNGYLTVKDMDDIPEDARRAIAAVSQTKHGLRIQFCSKEAMLRLLADIEGMTKPKESDADLPPINPEMGHDEAQA